MRHPPNPVNPPGVNAPQNRAIMIEPPRNRHGAKIPCPTNRRCQRTVLKPMAISCIAIAATTQPQCKSLSRLRRSSAPSRRMTFRKMKASMPTEKVSFSKKKAIFLGLERTFPLPAAVPGAR